MLHDLFLTLQTWWLDDAAGPQLLFAVRIASGTLAAIALMLAVINAVKPLEFEHTWDVSDSTRFRVIAWLKVLGPLLAVIYFGSAAIFEVERTSSPHRLLINNCWASMVFFGSIIDSMAWRYHYYRKRLIQDERDKNKRAQS